MKTLKTYILHAFLLLNLALEAQNTVKIGSQEWTSENLNVVIFRNGDTIPQAKTIEAWEEASKEGKPAWCYQVNLTEYGEKFGKLYNWYAVNDPRGLAPKGYHIPAKAEWDSLVSYLGGEEIAGKKLKSSEGWKNNGNGTNEIGFSGLPGGSRNNIGLFDNVGEIGAWWTASDNVRISLVEVAWCYHLKFYEDLVSENYDFKGVGMSVRCLRD